MASSPPVIAVVGSLNVDAVIRTPRVPVAGETLTASSFDIGYGGKGANQAVACARLSRTKAQLQAKSGQVADVRMMGAVGVDQFGKDLLRSLEDSGLDVSGVRKLEGQKTGVSTIIVEEATGQNRIMFTPNANFAVQKEDFLGEGAKVALFQLEMPMDVVLYNVELAKQKGISVIFNPAPAVPLPESIYPSIEHLIVNETEAAILSGKQPEDITIDSDLSAVTSIFVKRGVKNIIITLGSHGVFYHTSSLSLANKPGRLIPARKVKVIDTTAAGDTFVGAYAVAVAVGLEKGEFDIDNAIAYANRAAAMTVQKQGAQSAIPWLDEVPSE